MRFAPLLFALLAAAAAAHAASNVVIVVMDGLRPDSVVPAEMPNLSRLAAQGVFFERHHAVYISSTEVNGTALATGVTPGHSGIVGNREYRPQIDPLFPVDTQDEWTVWTGDRAGSDGWIRVETLPELVRAAGRRTAVVGSKTVALLWDRGRENRSDDSATVFEGDAVPSAVKDAVVAREGPIPQARDRRYFVNTPQDQWSTRALTDVLWSGGIPALSVLWLSEPDYSQHGTGPGSPQSRTALRSSDAMLGLVLTALDARGVRADTDVIVVSDHGFSTISQSIDVGADLARHGFRVGGGFLQPPPSGTVVIVGLGGSVALYVVERDPEVIGQLVTYLQSTSYAGVIFTRDPLPGTFRLSDAGIDSPDSPDVVLSMRWASEPTSSAGTVPGTLVYSYTDYSPGMGMHGSLSRFDMNNALIAAGPDFKAGLRSQTPSGNIDIAPTVLHLLGIDVPEEMDGRVLSEALAEYEGLPPAAEVETLRASVGIGFGSWQQYLTVSRVSGETYYDEGNAGEAPAER